MAWEERRMRREVRATANRLANFDDANLRRSARAAVAAGARVERALEILGDEVPDHLKMAGGLRLEHKQASPGGARPAARPGADQGRDRRPDPAAAGDGRQARRRSSASPTPRRRLTPEMLRRGGLSSPGRTVAAGLGYPYVRRTDASSAARRSGRVVAAAPDRDVAATTDRST